MLTLVTMPDHEQFVAAFTGAPFDAALANQRRLVCIQCDHWIQQPRPCESFCTVKGKVRHGDPAENCENWDE